METRNKLIFFSCSENISHCLKIKNGKGDCLIRVYNLLQKSCWNFGFLTWHRSLTAQFSLCSTWNKVNIFVLHTFPPFPVFLLHFSFPYFRRHKKLTFKYSYIKPMLQFLQHVCTPFMIFSEFNPKCYILREGCFEPWKKGLDTRNGQVTWLSSWNGQSTPIEK